TKTISRALVFRLQPGGARNRAFSRCGRLKPVHQRLLKRLCFEFPDFGFAGGALNRAFSRCGRLKPVHQRLLKRN
ncbi:MAG: hypothetical protein Q8M16_16685, partial [Pirellulaceae bacterium]|nr:hypothetical protein [Pirellulaceae bacterium]